MTAPGPSGQILVINCGSSSIKLTIQDPTVASPLARGLAQRLGEGNGEIELVLDGEKQRWSSPAANHAGALAEMIARLEEQLGEKLQITGVGHRVVHGGEAFSRSVRVDESVLRGVEECAALAPLHNPANLLGIRTALDRFPGVPHVAVFDTAFHQTLPREAYLYAIPYEYYESQRVRRYGFHGTSHHFVAEETARRLGRPLAELQLLTAHLGNGCSACAIRHGVSVDTTMGLTPLEGLVMGTRSGDVDPNLHDFLTGATGQSLAEVTGVLNRRSGLLGVSGLSNDMRTLEEAARNGHERAALAIDLFCYRLAKGLLALAAGLQRIDALVFTGGIGENSPGIRTRTLQRLSILRPEVDENANARHGAGKEGRITCLNTSGLRALVVPTNEELMIARETAALL